MSLREQALKGGAILVIRQGLGIVLSLIGVLVVTRGIGPYQYGLYAASFGIISFINSLGTWGLDVYLLRKKTHPQPQEYNQAFTLLLCISTTFSISIILGQHVLAHWLKLPQLAPILATLALALPLNLLNLPAIVKLDRDLNFKRVAYIELISQISYLLLAVPLAFKGAGAWAPTAGFLTQQGNLFVLSYWSTTFRPRLCWNLALIKEMLSYGLSYSSSMWVWQLKNLVNPVIVGRFAGAEAVAFVALSVRLTEMLSFAKDATWRISIAALANLGEDRVRLRNSIQEGMRLQALTVGLPLAGFALVAPTVLPLIFGERWNPVLQVFPLIAVSYLFNAIFTLHGSVLYLLQKNLLVAWFNVVHVALFAGSAVVLVPRLGFIGYGWAGICAIGSYLVIHAYVDKEVGSPSYVAALLWCSVVLAMLVLSELNGPLEYVALILPMIPLISASERSVLGNYAQLLVRRNK